MSKGKGRRRKKHVAGIPHLLRQRGKQRHWSGWLGGREIGLGTADATAAAKRLHELAAERERAPAAGSAAAETPLAELAARFLEWVQPPRRSPRTVEAIESRVTMFVEAMEAMEVTSSAQVNIKVLERYVQKRIEAGVSARTVNRDLSPVARMFWFGKKNDLVVTNPLVGEDYKELRLPEPKADPSRPTLSPNQVDLFIRRAYEVLPLPYAALFELMAGTGIRLAEACHLEPADVDSAKKEVRIRPKKEWNPKNYRSREVPASEQTLKAARHFIRTRGDVSLERKAVWNRVEEVRQQVGLEHFSPHELRRAWASAMHHRGASLKQVSILLGHGSIAVTERYIKAVATGGHEYLPR